MAGCSYAWTCVTTASTQSRWACCSNRQMLRMHNWGSQPARKQTEPERALNVTLQEGICSQDMVVLMHLLHVAADCEEDGCGDCARQEEAQPPQRPQEGGGHHEDAAPQEHCGPAGRTNQSHHQDASPKAPSAVHTFSLTIGGNDFQVPLIRMTCAFRRLAVHACQRGRLM